MARPCRGSALLIAFSSVSPFLTAAPEPKEDGSKKTPGDRKDALLETRKLVETKREPNYAWQLPEPPKSTSSSKAPARVFRWAFVDLEAEKKNTTEMYDRAIAHYEEEAKKAKDEEKEKLEMQLARIRAARAQLLARYGTIRCKVQQVGDPETYVLLHVSPLDKQVRLNDFVQSLRADLKTNFADLKISEDGVQEKRFSRLGWEGVRFTAEGKPNQAEGDERVWLRLLHFRKVTKQGKGQHLWIHCFAPSWKADRAFTVEIERVLAGLVLSK